MAAGLVYLPPLPLDFGFDGERTAVWKMMGYLLS
jgi:hypothetical protein